MPDTGLAAKTRTHGPSDIGLPLRVLHVGNVANNAYNNAKVQRARGVEADVLCFDYYHVMACPEWEDADFAGDIGDPLFPDWANVDLKGYARPGWFAQGSLKSCVAYLGARAGGDPKDIDRRLWRMNLDRWIVCRRTPAARVCRLALKGARRAKLFLIYARRFLRLLTILPWLAVFVPVMGMRHNGMRSGLHGAYVDRASDGIDRLRRHARRAARLRRRRNYARYMRRLGDALRQRENERLAAHAALNRLYTDWFPDRPDRLLVADLRAAMDIAERLKTIAVNYDVVQLYATFALYGHLAGLQRYAAYEHGTLRDIPFAADGQARITCLGYRLAPVVFMTNSDNFRAVERLGIDEDRLVCLPHAFDNSSLLAFQERNPDLRPAGTVTFFAPARHQWHAKSQGDKGNDRIVRAARLLEDDGLAFAIHFIDWGDEAALTRRLVDELGLGHRVVWHATMRKRELWRHYLTAHAVLDQFTLPAIGGITFEAMTLGRRVITNLDRSDLVRFFGVFPPVFSAATPAEIADACRHVIDDPADGGGRGRQCRDWIDTYHSAQRVHDIQMSAYRRLLSPGRHDDAMAGTPAQACTTRLAG